MELWLYLSIGFAVHLLILMTDPERGLELMVNSRKSARHMLVLCSVTGLVVVLCWPLAVVLGVLMHFERWRRNAP